MLTNDYHHAHQAEIQARKDAEENNTNNTAENKEEMKEEKKQTYLCCGLAPSIMNGTYELHVKQEMIVDVNDMEDEIQVEYDSATRFYYILV